VRHQEDGYQVSVGAGYGVSINNENPCYLSFGAGARYANLLNRYIQFNAAVSTGYTTSELPSVINYLGPDHVKGITTGERWGKAIWSASTGFQVTYINRDWFAIEQSFFVNAGNAENGFKDLYSKSPLMSAGTSIRFMVPFIPWLGIRFYYAWRGGADNWFSMEF
jgi:outer membrane protein assembly factor BamA